MLRLGGWRLYFRRHPQSVALVIMFVILFVMVSSFLSNEAKPPPGLAPARYTYQQSYLKYDRGSTRYNISVVADKDKNSKNGNAWESILLNGELMRDRNGLYSMTWKEEIKIKSRMNEDGRGMELSDLTYFNNVLYTFDDRTGIVYEIDTEKSLVIARYILADGNGRNNKGFKCEWSTVKDGLLYVGGLGKEWTNPEGEIISHDPQYVKTIDVNGKVDHINWVSVYEALRAATGTLSPGYLIHEAVRFNPVDRRWYFMPRRASKEMYNDVADEKRGSDIVIHTDEYFEDIQTFHIGELIPSHGFSSFAFIPYREHEVIALKTEELEGAIATYITAFDFVNRKVLMEETKIGDVKFEGIDFL